MIDIDEGVEQFKSRHIDGGLLNLKKAKTVGMKQTI